MKITGSGREGLPKYNLEQMMFPLPPLAEQHRIAAEIEKWFALIDQIEQGKTSLQTTIKHTKSKILDLAIHGRLVPQDPSDEPAIELMKRINPKAEITGNDELDEMLPQGWMHSKLGSIVNIVNGKSQKEVESVSGEYPIYGSGGIIGRANNYSCESGSTIIGRKGTINKPILVQEKFWNVDTAFGMKPCSVLSDKYFFFFCQAFDFSKLDKSTALPSLTKSAIGDIDFPLPPLPEQHRIAAKIEELFSALDNIQKTLEA